MSDDDWVHFTDFNGRKISHYVNADRKCTCEMCQEHRDPYNQIAFWDKCKCEDCQTKVKEIRKKYG